MEYGIWNMEMCYRQKVFRRFKEKGEDEQWNEGTYYFTINSTLSTKRSRWREKEDKCIVNLGMNP